MGEADDGAVVLCDADVWTSGDGGDDGGSEASSGGTVYESADAGGGKGYGYVSSVSGDGKSGVAEVSASSGYVTEADAEVTGEPVYGDGDVVGVKAAVMSDEVVGASVVEEVSESVSYGGAVSSYSGVASS